MYEHAVVSATWAESPIYCRIIPWSERILGMSRADAMAQRERYSRGEVWCVCVSDVYPEGFEASIGIDTMSAISVEEFETARVACARAAGAADDDEVAVTGRARRLTWLRRRHAVAS